MPYCPRCGVEVDASVNQCPLCSTSIPRFADLGPGTPTWPSPGHPSDPNLPYAGPPSKRKWGAIFGAFCLTAAAVVAVVDLAVTGGLTWSLWPLASLAFGFALVALTLVGLPKGVVGLGWFVLVSLLLGAFDLIDGPPSWFWPLGFPINTLVFGLTGLGALGASRCRGAALLALGALLIGGGLVALDGLISSWVGTGVLGWSLVTSVVFGAFAVFFGLLHLVLGAPRFHRIFHF